MHRRKFLQIAPLATLTTHQLVGTLFADKTRSSTAPISVGTQRQLFLDDFWFAQKKDIKLALHLPVPREAVITCDQPWEKRHLHYSCVLKDGELFRMWYRADDGRGRTSICYAESRDGIQWDKPKLGLVPWGGSRENNIIFPNPVIPGGNGCSVIVDPHAAKDERYKLITARSTAEIWGYVSADGLQWREAAPGPILDKRNWGYDSHNILLWDEERQRYVIFCRGWIDKQGKTIMPKNGDEKTLDFSNMFRVIRRSESSDFRTWSKPEMIVAADKDDPPHFDFYTNAAIKYPRAARAWFMFPMVLIQGGRRFPGAPHAGTSDVQFMTSRDGHTWDRRFRRPYLHHGQDKRNWVDRNPIMGVGMLQTRPEELSLYYSELYRSPASQLRRATLRTDGFVSAQGPYRGWGKFTTLPLSMNGRELELNYRTSGGGTIQVELQNAEGKPLPGFALADCPDIFGDKIAGIVRWKTGSDLSRHANHPIRLRVRMRDADLFAFRFRD